MSQNQTPHIAMLSTAVEMGPDWAPQGQGQRDTNFNAIRRAGGLLIMLPYMPGDDAAVEALERYDGLYIAGGYDVHPSLSGAEPHKRGDEIDHLMTKGCDKERDLQQSALVHRAIELGIPILGICYGLEIIDVSFGGELYSDLDHDLAGNDDYTPSAHMGPLNSHWADPRLEIRTTDNSQLRGLIGENALVGCMHHQAIKRLGAGVVATAYAQKDHLIEAIEVEGSSFVLGLQPHGEVNDFGKPVFDAFIRIAAETAERQADKLSIHV